MPATPTPRLGLHRPSGSDPANVPSDLATLTGQLDEAAIYRSGTLAARPAANAVPPGTFHRATNGSIAVSDGTNWKPITDLDAPVATLPASPYTGQRVVFQTAGMGWVRWQLCYDGSNWQFEGGAPLTSKETASGTSSASSLTLIANGPSLTAPATGTYIVEAHASAGGGGYGAVSMALRKDSTTIEEVGGISALVYWQPWQAEVALTAGQVLAIWGKNSAGDSTVYGNRMMKLIPVKL